MNKRLFILIVLVFGQLCFAQSQSLVASFVGSFATFFNPFQYIKDYQTGLNEILAVTLKWGAGLVVVLLGFEFARRYFTESGFSLSNSIRTFVFAGGIMMVLYPIQTTKVSGAKADPYIYETIFVGGILSPLDNLTTTLAKSNQKKQVDQQQDYVNSLAKNLQENKLKLAASLLTSKYLDIIIGPLVILGWAIAWVMSFYVDIVCALLYVVGPLFIPFFVFKPMSSIAWSWFRTFISYPIMAIFGNIIFTMMCSQNIYVDSVTLASGNKILHAVPYLLTQILVMIMIPSIVSGIMSSVAPSITAAAKTFAGGVKSTADTVKGATAAYGIVSAASHVSQGAAMYNAGVSSASPRLLESGQAMINRGTQMQLASEQKFRQAMPTVATLLSVGSEPSGSFARQASRMSPEQQRSAMAQSIQATEGIAAANQFRQDTLPGGPGEGLAAGPLRHNTNLQQGFGTAAQRAKLAIDANRQSNIHSLRDANFLSANKKFDISSNSLDGNLNLMAEAYAKKCGVPAANRLAENLKKIGFNPRSYTGDLSQDLQTNLEEAQRLNSLVGNSRELSTSGPGANAYTLSEVTQFNKGMDFDFTLNTPENNRGLMKEYTRERFNEQEASLFEKVATSQNANITAVGGGMKSIHDAVVEVYKNAGVDYGKMHTQNGGTENG